MWYCRTCGSNDVEGQQWVNLNTDEIGETVDDEKYWCNDCTDYCQITDDPNDNLSDHEMTRGEEKFESKRENDK